MNGLWGVECSIDLKRCDHEIITNKEKIGQFIVEVCDMIHVKRFGMPTIANFGEGAKISGYSFVQLIEESLISGHLVNSTNAAYINLFSCKKFDVEVAVEFTKDFFKADGCEFIVNYRQI